MKLKKYFGNRLVIAFLYFKEETKTAFNLGILLHVLDSSLNHQGISYGIKIVGNINGTDKTLIHIMRGDFRKTLLYVWSFSNFLPKYHPELSGNEFEIQTAWENRMNVKMKEVTLTNLSLNSTV